MAIYGINYINESTVEDITPVIQQIFNIIDNNIDYSFDKLLVKGTISDGYYEYKFWLNENGKTIDCFKLLTHKECLNIFMKIDKVLRPVWKRHNSKDKFHTFEIEYRSDGSFSTKYGYDE